MFKTFQDNLKSLYYHIPHKYRIEKDYLKIIRFLNASQWWDKKKIQNWQLQKLQKIIKYAYVNVPAYTSLYRESRVKPQDIQNLSDIKHLPFVTKEMIRDNLEQFTAKSFPSSDKIYTTTAGSTGIPFGFYQPKFLKIIEKAFIHSGWQRAGWKLGEKSIILRGGFIGSQDEIWHFNRYRREAYKKDLLLSTYYLTEDTYDQYIRKILQHRPFYLRAYPSAATILADLILEKFDAGRIGFHGILLSSENLYSLQTERIKKAFPGSRIFEWYGHAEKVILAPYCEYNNKFHIWPFYGLTEILDQESNDVNHGQFGELVGTSFWNYVTPFIRYKTTDIAKKGRFGCEDCGRRFQLLDQISGRLQEIVITRNGRYISMTAINMHNDLFDNIKQFQFYQDIPGKVSFKIIRKDTYNDNDTVRIRSELLKKLGDDFELDIIFVNEIPRTPRGKYRFLEQKLEIKYGE